jgi:hypothetical protein
MSKALILILALLSIFALLTGCTQTSTTPTASGSGYPLPSSSTPTTESSSYPAPSSATATTSNPQTTAYPAGNNGTGSLEVVASDGTVKEISLADLNDLPKITVGNESGPKLADVLQFANIFDFTSVTVAGTSGSKDLAKDQVTNQVILTVANNSIALVVGGANGSAVQGVTKITVK